MPNQIVEFNVLYMSTVEIAELTQKRHDNVMRKAKELSARGIINAPQIEERYGKNNFRSIYRLNKTESLNLVANLSPEFTARIIDRWQELEEQNKSPEIPQTLPEALRLAADMAEKNQALTQQIEEQAPLVNLAERCLLLGKNLCLRDAAKVAEMSPKQFNLALLERKFIYRTVKNQLRPYQQAINKGLMQAKYHFYINSKGEESMNAQPLITPYGLQEILRFLGIKSPSIPNF